MKYTQGEWKVVRKINVKSTDGYICSCAAVRNGMNISNEKEMNEANAKLISAAPDLLEALKELLNMVYSDQNIENALLKSKIAIDKATN